MEIDLEARLKFELKNTKDAIEKEQLKLEAVLSQHKVNSMDYGIYSFGWVEKTANRFNQKKFGEDHPDLLEKYKTPSTSKSFEFKINK